MKFVRKKKKTSSRPSVPYHLAKLKFRNKKLLSLIIVLIIVNYEYKSNAKYKVILDEIFSNNLIIFSNNFYKYIF